MVKSILWYHCRSIFRLQDITAESLAVDGLVDLLSVAEAETPAEYRAQ